MSKKLYEMLEENPIIASIKDDEGLKSALTSECKIVFILYGNVVSISEIVQKLRNCGKMIFIDVDLIIGFSSKEIVIDFLKQYTQADGILSSKAYMIKAANSHGFLTIHKLFIIDSFSFYNVDKQVKISQPDCIEILPGIMPKVISWIIEKIDIPVIAGGLVCEKEDVMASLKAGAIAISTTNAGVWSL